MSATLAELRGMIEEAERLGAPGDARVTGRTALGGLVSGLTIEWVPAAKAYLLEWLGAETCPCVGVASEAAVPGHENHRRPDGTMPPACAEAARRVAEDGQPHITVVNLDPDLVRRVCAETDLGTFR